MAWARFRKKRDMPEGLWVKCPGCEATLFKKELGRNLKVCTECNHHFSVTGRERVEMTVDGGSFVEFDPNLHTVDRLEFEATGSYVGKLRKAIEKSGTNEAALYGTCTIGGHPAVLCVIDFSFIGGSMGTVVGEKVTRAVELGTKKRWPVIVISASGGARMHEGALSLMQMAKTSVAIDRHGREGLLYISVLTNPTTGGVMASFAAVGDVILAEPDALIGFAGPRVIQETLRQQLPDGFQRSEFLLEHGFLDRITPREAMHSTLSSLLDYLAVYEDPSIVLTESAWNPPAFPPEEGTPDESTPEEASAAAPQEAKTDA
ncbi:MAG: acetyl-CoA carboxylase, carboxyltransferase subunit beta [Planctomycetota bacterium]